MSGTSKGSTESGNHPIGGGCYIRLRHPNCPRSMSPRRIPVYEFCPLALGLVNWRDKCKAPPPQVAAMNENLPGTPHNLAKSSQTGPVVWIVVGVAIAIAAMLVLLVCAGVFAYVALRSEVAPMQPRLVQPAPVPMQAPVEERPQKVIPAEKPQQPPGGNP